uniref:Uncharacterized protein n=1 Tax=Magnetococcus massalia (strain MO-1) TaxID=451514 RepID=A0A1S7LHB9_MAGMO|nr:protein of unknown function [Candidatus Magnetococcus massalia]
MMPFQKAQQNLLGRGNREALSKTPGQTEEQLVDHVSSAVENFQSFTLEQHVAELQQLDRNLYRAITAQQRVLDTMRTQGAKLDVPNGKLEDLRTELNLVQQKLVNAEKSYQERLGDLQKIYLALQALTGRVNADTLQHAQSALARNDTSLASALFAQVQEAEDEAIERAAQAAFERGIVAEGELDYSGAMDHYRRAVTLQPQETGYLFRTAVMARKARHYDEAQQLAEQLVQQEAQNYPQNVRALCRAQALLASIYKRQGEHKQSAALYERVLLVEQSLPDQETMETATTLSKLGELYDDMGLYERALTTFEQALAIKRKVLGEQNPSLADTLNNMATIYDELGRYSKALETYEQALLIKRRALGDAHPSLAMILNNMGIVYQELGKYREAEEKFEENLRITESQLGVDHLSVSDALNNLGIVCQEQGKYAVALEKFEEGLRITRNILGPDHAAVADTLNNIGIVYQEQGEYEAAKEKYEEALVITKVALGPDHPTVGMTLENIGVLLARHMHCPSTACRNYFREAERIFKQAYQNPAHPNRVKLAATMEEFC